MFKRRTSYRHSLVVMLALAALQSPSLGQDRLWIEAEHFEDPGGWVNDWQFIDQMGSPFLMAIGYGAKVKDAATRLRSGTPGRYRMWVRTHDWFPEKHPGRFRIGLNGKTLALTFGASGKEGWIWEDGGVVTLSADNRLELEDLTGYYGRCDAIVFSKDLTWRPPDELSALRALRVEAGAVSRDIQNKGSYDVVVVGGGVAGCLAAVSAARQGVKTALIQNRGQLGGNASLENLVPPVGFRQTLLKPEERLYDPRETGLIEEIAPYGGQTYFEVGRLWPDRLLKLVNAEPALDLFLNTHATDVQMEEAGRIGGVTCIEIPSGNRISVQGKLFIDCTGNGVIGLKAGAQYLYGREARSDYNEIKAPETADKTTLPSSVKYWFTEQAEETPFTAPDWIYRFHSCDDFGTGRHPRIGPIDNQWVIELGGTDETYLRAESVRDDLFRLIYGIWDHLKNHCPEARGKAGKMKLAWVGHVVGLRESYRLLGDYVMRESDVTEQPLTDDRIAYGGWGLDDHPSLGFFDKERLNNHTHGGVYHSIPYRSLYSKNVENLMMAGRNISATHVALTATRVMYATGVIGQAAGTAAGMCIRLKETPRGIYRNHLQALQQSLLKEGAFLIEVPNEDPADLALSAHADASSGKPTAAEVINGFARARFGVMFPGARPAMNAWVPDSSQSSAQWLSRGWDTPRTFNTVHVTFQNRGRLAYEAFALEKFEEGRGWVTLANVRNESRRRRLVIPVEETTSKGIRLVLKESKPYGVSEIRVYRESAETLEGIRRANNLEATFADAVPLPWEENK